MYYIELLLVGISLSMDAFSLSFSLSRKIKNHNKYAICVGLFHFIMPMLGVLMNRIINTIIYIPSREIFIAVIVFIIIGILIDKKDNLDKFINPIIFAFAVSIDSFTIGLSITSNYIIPSLIFTLCSYTFTKFGFLFGKILKNKQIVYDKLISVLILVFLLIYNILA